MLTPTLLTLLLTSTPLTSAFPWVATLPGVDTSLLRTSYIERRQQASPLTCPYNSVHKGAAPIKGPYWYNNATNGIKGNEKGGFRVPAVGDKAHQFVAPDYTKDIRGPCPGLNAAANHNFLSHDGIATYNELVDAQQNIYNVGYDLANLLAVLGLTLADGDIATQRLSIGCDATNRTSVNPVLTGSEPGLNGHNKFEADSSLTRNDYFVANGDNYNMNTTLFTMMTQTCARNYSLNQLALYRYQRYHQSIAQNPNFYFGPFSLLLYGAASFLYELMPSGTRGYRADYYTISSFFGITQVNGKYVFTGKERIPDNWTNRVAPYTNNDVTTQILAMYLKRPVLFGGNTGNGQFDLLTTSDGSFSAGKLTATSPTSLTCLLYQLTTERVPSGLNGFLTPTVEAINFAVSKLGPAYNNLGCPVPLTRR